jgi:four helix bundle protein
MHNIKELHVWNKAMDLALEVYNISANFPSDERFGLISQTRRCAVSIASNISEGAGRNTKGEFHQFLGFANGSAYELQTQLLIAERLKFISSDLTRDLLDSVDAIQKMIYKLQQSLKNS